MSQSSNSQASATFQLHKDGYGNWDQLVSAISPTSVLPLSERGRLTRLALMAHPGRQDEILRSYHS